MSQANIVLGILLAYFSNFVISEFHLGADQWVGNCGGSRESVPHPAVRKSAQYGRGAIARQHARN
ncbi:hypothetical protein ACPOL_2770 [Acidisarcina polymorpha]|uniref:Uncharacterized protein n=1 Tax=Acidisarcina polymorpha TaxID=2211140 RepID=A0A2Z5FYZ4_9BACT|nr:hypothetical protein [Acidisarcina polymorpha]AXC12081.1 hypothetical protein ACPOL_2770 [Acidisarcina polymorpha]